MATWGDIAWKTAKLAVLGTAFVAVAPLALEAAAGAFAEEGLIGGADILNTETSEGIGEWLSWASEGLASHVASPYATLLESDAITPQVMTDWVSLKEEVIKRAGEQIIKPGSYLNMAGIGAGAFALGKRAADSTWQDRIQQQRRQAMMSQMHGHQA